MERMSDGKSDDDEQGRFKRILSGAGEVSKEVFVRVITEAVTRVMTPGR